MSTPLREAVEGYLAKGRARFHMPGHKGRPLPLFADIARFDITEVEGADSLYGASGAIAETEARYAALYGSAASLLSAGGSTLCIQAMLALACPPGSKLLAGRGAHAAAVNAMALLDLEPVWIYPRTDPATGLALALTPKEAEEALLAHPDAAALYLTSPDYFGAVCDVAAISAACRRRGVPLLVDNAHGAHLAFLEPALHPIRLGADLCCDSLHKTLPVLTGGALLHIGNPRFLPEAKRRMALFGSTSPSYLVLLSADTALPYLESGVREDLARCARRNGALAALAGELGYRLPAGALDPVRLTLGFAGIGYTKEEYGAALRAQRIEPEYLGAQFCVLMASPFTADEDFARLEGALRQIPPRAPLPVPSLPELRPRRACSLREAGFSPGRTIPLSRAAGRVAGGVFSPCPPGIPLVLPGEILDGALCALLKNDGIQAVNVIY